MSTLIKTIPVETRSDAQLSLQIHEIKTYQNDEVISVDNRLCVVIDQRLGLEDDGTLAVMLVSHQVDKLISQLLTAKAELEVRNKNINK